MIKIISDTPWYLYLLCILIGITYAAVLYYRSRATAELSPFLKKLLFVIRTLTVAFICLLLAKIFIKQTSNVTETPVVILAVDNSTSLLQKDSAQIIKELSNGLKNDLANKFKVATLLFGEGTRNSDSISFRDKETDIGDLLSYIDNNYAGVNVGAMVVITDGIFNKGSDPSFALDKINFPIYSVALGDTTVQKDAWIHKTEHNQVTYLGNQFVCQITVNASKLKGEKLKVKVSKNGQVNSEQTLSVNSDNFSSQFAFVGEAVEKGIQKYTVSIESLKNEISTRNNTQNFVIDVIDNRDKLLLISEAPHPDINAISECVNGLKNYELIKQFGDFNDQPLKPYSCVIIHGDHRKTKKIISDCIASNVPYFLINPELLNNIQEVKLLTKLDKPNDSEPHLNSSFGYFTISEELRSQLANFPAVKTPFGKYALANGAQVLLQQKVGSVITNDPMLIFNELNGSKSAVFIGDGLWKWRLRNFQESKNFNAFNELISKSIQYLSVKSDKSFFRIFTNKIINENEQMEFNAEVYNKTYELITEPDVTLRLTNDKKVNFDYTFSKQNKTYKLNAGLFEPGEYTYEAKVKVADQVLTKKGVIAVKPVMAEMNTTVANHALLYRMASASNGSVFYKEQKQQLIDAIAKNDYVKPVTYSDVKTSELIELKWLLAMIITFLSIEWFIRKFSGTI